MDGGGGAAWLVWVNVVIDSGRREEIDKHVLHVLSPFDIQTQSEERLMSDSFMARVLHSELIFEYPSEDIGDGGVSQGCLALHRSALSVLPDFIPLVFFFLRFLGFLEIDELAIESIQDQTEELLCVALLVVRVEFIQHLIEYALHSDHPRCYLVRTTLRIQRYIEESVELDEAGCE